MMDNGKRIVICDLDGTLCDSDHRAHLVQAGRWDEFHAASASDIPNNDVLVNLLALDRAGVGIIAITGRNELYRGQTEHWLRVFSAPIETVLMRPDGNFESDSKVKTELLERWLEETKTPPENILFALEDRDSMVDAWRGHGIPCWQVRAGSF